MARLMIGLVVALGLLAAGCGDDTGDDGETGTTDGGVPDDGGSVSRGDDTADETPTADPGDTGADADGAPGGPTGDDGTSGGDDGAQTRPADGRDAYPVANLSVTVTHPDRPTVSYVVSCLGDTATVLGTDDVDAVAACLALNDPEVRTLLTQGPPPDQICTEEYGGPDEAVVEGLLDDVEVDARVTRTNGCRIDEWDRVLADVLPPAVGVVG